MINIQNEISYVIAWNILRKLCMDNIIDKREFGIAHDVITNRFHPLTVRR